MVFGHGVRARVALPTWTGKRAPLLWTSPTRSIACPDVARITRSRHEVAGSTPSLLSFKHCLSGGLVLAPGKNGGRPPRLVSSPSRREGSPRRSTIAPPMLELDLQLTAEQALDACRRHGLVVQSERELAGAGRQPSLAPPGPRSSRHAGAERVAGKSLGEGAPTARRRLGERLCARALRAPPNSIERGVRRSGVAGRSRLCCDRTRSTVATRRTPLAWQAR